MAVLVTNQTGSPALLSFFLVINTAAFPHERLHEYNTIQIQYVSTASFHDHVGFWALAWWLPVPVYIFLKLRYAFRAFHADFFLAVRCGAVRCGAVRCGAVRCAERAHIAV